MRRALDRSAGRTSCPRACRNQIGRRSLNKACIWIPLALLFLAPFVDPRRPVPPAPPRPAGAALLRRRAAATSTRASSTSGCRPCTRCCCTCWRAWLLAGFRPRERSEPLMPVREGVVAAGRAGVLLVAFRIGAQPRRLDGDRRRLRLRVGADRRDGRPAPVRLNDIHGDTYGPLNYLELSSPRTAPWDGAGARGAGPRRGDLTSTCCDRRPGAAGPAACAQGARAAARPRARLGLGGVPVLGAGAPDEHQRRAVAMLLVGALLAICVAGRPRRAARSGRRPPSSPRSRWLRCSRPGSGTSGACVAWPAFAGALAAVCFGSVVLLPPRRRLAGVLRHDARLPAEPLVAVQPVGPAPVARLAAERRQGGRGGVWPRPWPSCRAAATLRQVAALAAARS